MYIAISGKKGSGKTTLAAELRTYWGSRGVASLRYSLAEPIAAMAQAVYAVGRHYGIEPPPGGKDSNLMQALGDEWGNRVDPDIWIRAAKHKIAGVTRLWEEKGLFYIIILERICHPHQLAAWPTAYKIRLDAPEDVRRARCEHWPANPNHLSETALDNAEFDVRFDTSVMSTQEIVEAVAGQIRERFHGRS